MKTVLFLASILASTSSFASPYRDARYACERVFPAGAAAHQNLNVMVIGHAKGGEVFLKSNESVYELTWTHAESMLRYQSERAIFQDPSEASVETTGEFLMPNDFHLTKQFQLTWVESRPLWSRTWVYQCRETI
jgi:hypothetical protein